MPAIGLVVFACALIFTALTAPEAIAPSLSPPAVGSVSASTTAIAPPSTVPSASNGGLAEIAPPSARGSAPSTAVATPSSAAAAVTPPKIPLGSRPESDGLSYWGDCPAVIEGHTFRGLGPGVIAIRLENCSNVLIRDNDFIDVAEGVYVLGGSNVSVIGNRFQNIVGPSTRDGGIHGNFVMFNGVRSGLIANNEGRCGDTEDTISLYRSSHVIVASNYLEGAFDDSPDCLAWSSSSGTGINVNDGGGTGNIVRDNTLVNPHRVGIGVAGGADTLVENNVIYSARRQAPDTVFGIAVENYSAEPCTGITVRGNRILWTNSSGGASPIWANGDCRTASDRRSRRNDRTLDPASLLESFRASTGSKEAAGDTGIGLGGW
jgi:parallel beta-helix repeat protein